MKMKTLRELTLDRGLAHNVVALYGVQFSSYLLPLVTIPYLTRVLGATTWGLVAFAQAFGAYASLVVEYGFDYSATREVAKSRGSKEVLSSLVAGVLGAKILLAVCAVGLAAIAEHWIPLFHRHAIFFWAAMFWALAQAFSMLWYYQGFERMRFVAVLDVAGRALATAGIFILVRNPGDGWKVLALQGAGALVSVMIATLFVFREVRFRLPNGSLILKTLRMGWNMFIFRSSLGLFSTGNAFILGLFAPADAVGFYAGAEKIARAFMGLLAPVYQSLFPRFSHLVKHDRPTAQRLARVTLLVISSMGALSSLVVFVAAPWIVRIILGKGFAPTVPVLRIMAALIFLDAVSTMLGMLWMVPLGLDRLLSRIVLAAGALNLILALIMAPRFAETGVASAVVAAEVFGTCALYAILHHRGLSPLATPRKE
jgi:polysaccharide transporter, PST family